MLCSSIELAEEFFLELPHLPIWGIDLSLIIIIIFFLVFNKNWQRNLFLNFPIYPYGVWISKDFVLELGPICPLGYELARNLFLKCPILPIGGIELCLNLFFPDLDTKWQRIAQMTMMLKFLLLDYERGFLKSLNIMTLLSK
ncbi:hypothetical protein HanXRQr2_Chr16g0731281 [Helianthus annuus]|uniref:Uncharacterized protein n=1 Tax=Helianthus annuus TaxID=4232 RepID=A0A9K3GWZ7_HELAN|nr:hypothetical protein HanXRQr2_Chr16g0731281 [Helianthus annuus]KAJ0436932.1 hypothetical protein HanHA300_Chr16g0596171 [Helianthus annuus]KAJ0459244.1 hypothetical protein HanHA89_Chr16g0646661 [Helianthus annuus]